MYQRVFFGPVSNPENEGIADLNRRELLYLVPIVVFCFWLGLYPKPFFRLIEKPVDYIVQKVDPDYLVSEAARAVPRSPSAAPAGETSTATHAAAARD
jgi:NADH-quinone oxidoreductase subunit M